MNRLMNIEQLEAAMNKAANLVEECFPPKTGFAIFTFDPSKDEKATASYISNVEQDYVKQVLQNFIDRKEPTE